MKRDTTAARPIHALQFAHLPQPIDARDGETVYQSARRAGVRVVGACGGRGTCGSCVVRVIDGRYERSDQAAASEPGADQAQGAIRSRKKWVKACQIRVRSDCTIEVAPRSLARVARAETDDASQRELLELEPQVRNLDLQLDEPTLLDHRADADRLRDAAAGAIASIDLAAARALPPLLRAHAWSVRARLRDGELIDVAAPGARCLGLAVDLGTTNAAGFLIDLQSGERLASLGIENPQAAWGADLISRINDASRDAEAARELHAAAARAINALAIELCQAVDTQPACIVDVAICGNTAMHHLLLGLPVRQLGRAPFVAALRASPDIKARDLGLAVSPGAYVHLAPNIGGFVGGDHVCALLATEPRWSAAKVALVMDIGTNTEISVIHDGRLFSASSPSGPALEGGHISCGMRAADGAIERVTLADGRLAVRTIGNEAPVGLCGSGVLDALATLLRAGVVDARGRILAGHPDVELIDGKRVVRLAPGVYFTQPDIRAVQLAKSAIRTATEMLLAQAGLAEQDVEQFIIAGSFGAYIDLESGIATGLFPDLPRERYAQVGNAAGVGVRQMLASGRARTRAAELARACRYVELATQSEFQQRFLHHIGFEPGRLI